MNSLYILFMMESRNIKEIRVDGKLENLKLLNYFNKLAGPYHDYGILQHFPVKIKWILMENNVENYMEKRFEVKYVNMYLDDDKCELMEHDFRTDNVEDYFITEHMKDVLIKKNREYGRIIKFN